MLGSILGSEMLFTCFLLLDDWCFSEVSSVLCFLEAALLPGGEEQRDCCSTSENQRAGGGLSWLQKPEEEAVVAWSMLGRSPRGLGS